MADGGRGRVSCPVCILFCVFHSCAFRSRLTPRWIPSISRYPYPSRCIRSLLDVISTSTVLRCIAAANTCSLLTDVLLLCVIHLLSAPCSLSGRAAAEACLRTGPRASGTPGASAEKPPRLATSSRKGYSEAASGRWLGLTWPAASPKSNISRPAGTAAQTTANALFVLSPSASLSLLQGLAVQLSGFVPPASTQPIPTHISTTMRTPTLAIVTIAVLGSALVNASPLPEPGSYNSNVYAVSSPDSAPNSNSNSASAPPHLHPVIGTKVSREAAPDHSPSIFSASK